jgi:hypothetical protein
VAAAGVHQDAGQELPLGEGGAVAVAGRVGLDAPGDVAEDGARQEAARWLLEVIEAKDVPEPARYGGAAAPAGDARLVSLVRVVVSFICWASTS